MKDKFAKISERNIDNRKELVFNMYLDYRESYRKEFISFARFPIGKEVII